MTDERSNEVGLPEPPARPPGPGAATTPRVASSVSSPWVACILAGVATGLIGFGLGEASHDAFQPRAVRQQVGPGVTDRPTLASRQEALVKNSSLAFAGWGAALGLAMGLAGRAVTCPPRHSVAGAVLGAALGGLAGAIIPTLVIPLASWAQFQHGIDPMLSGTGAQLAMWSLAAAAAGAGFGWAAGGRRDVPRAALSAMLGAVAGTLIYAAASMYYYPMAETDQPLAAAWQPRLLARLLPSLGAAVTLAASRGKAVRQVPPPVAEAPAPAA